MAYRFNGVECDTVEELRALTGYPMNQVLASGKATFHESKAGFCVENSGRTPAPTGIYDVGSRDWVRPGGDHP